MARRTRRPVVETFSTGANLRWDVRWVVKKKGRWHIRIADCGDDLAKAVDVYRKALTGEHRYYVTLRCKNSGFPPPEHLRPHWHKKKVKKEVKRRGKTRTATVVEDVYRRPMRRLNRVDGIWWCPYCRELREFVAGHEQPYIHPPVAALKGFGNGRPDYESGRLYCPMCYISTADHTVRKWNPLAERF